MLSVLIWKDKDRLWLYESFSTLFGKYSKKIYSYVTVLTAPKVSTPFINSRVQRVQTFLWSLYF